MKEMRLFDQWRQQVVSGMKAIFQSFDWKITQEQTCYKKQAEKKVALLYFGRLIHFSGRD